MNETTVYKARLLILYWDRCKRLEARKRWNSVESPQRHNAVIQSGRIAVAGNGVIITRSLVIRKVISTSRTITAHEP